MPIYQDDALLLLKEGRTFIGLRNMPHKLPSHVKPPAEGPALKTGQQHSVKGPQAKSLEQGASSSDTRAAGRLARAPDLFPVLPGALLWWVPLLFLLCLTLRRYQRQAVLVLCNALLLRCWGTT